MNLLIIGTGSFSTENKWMTRLLGYDVIFLEDNSVVRTPKTVDLLTWLYVGQMVH